MAENQANNNVYYAQSDQYAYYSFQHIFYRILKDIKPTYYNRSEINNFLIL